MVLRRLSFLMDLVMTDSIFWEIGDFLVGLSESTSLNCADSKAEGVLEDSSSAGTGRPLHSPPLGHHSEREKAKKAGMPVIYNLGSRPLHSLASRSRKAWPLLGRLSRASCATCCGRVLLYVSLAAAAFLVFDSSRTALKALKTKKAGMLSHTRLFVFRI